MADQTLIAKLSEDIADLIVRAEPGVVGLRSSRRHGGSGIVWQSGVIVAADETVRAGENTVDVTMPDGTETTGTVAGRDPSTDLIVLRIAPGAGAEPTSLETTPARRGALVVTLGRRGAAPIGRLGMIAETGESWQSLRGGRIDRLIRLDTALDRVAEGGGVFDASGALIGMAVFGPRGRVIVIPVETIRRIVPQILTRGSPGRGYLGLGLHSVPARGASPAGVMVVSIDPHGPGASAGALLGDVLTTWDGAPIRGLREVVGRLGPDAIGTEVTLDLIRAGNATRMTVQIRRRPED